MTASGAGVPAAGLPPALAKVRHLARHQIAGLTGEFLLGMAANLTGQPSQASGDARIASLAFLAAHGLIALGLVVGAALLLRAAARAGGWRLRQAAGGAGVITVTMAAGVLTMLTASNWWSYAMSAGFISAFLIYGRLLIRPE